jgi:hypothetical protein
MSTKTYSVSLETMFKVHQKMRALESIIDEMEGHLAICWQSWEECYLYDCIIDRFKDAQTSLAVFDNKYDLMSKGANDVQYGIYKFTTLTHSLNRCLNVLGLDAMIDKDYIKDYQKFLKSFEKFYEIAASLHNDMGDFR